MLVDYKDMDFVFVTNHYDIHIEGLCRINNKLWSFKLYDMNDAASSVYAVTPLNCVDTLKAVIAKKAFEICVGYHWTYPNRTNGEEFYMKSPKWFWNMVFHLYYKVRGK